MCNVLIKRVVGVGAFFLPAMVAAVGEVLDHFHVSYDPVYASFISYVFWGTFLLAAIVPAVLVMKARMPLMRRVSLVGVIWCGVLIEFYLIVLLVLSDIQ
jgi:hypothetical protein